MSKPKIMYLSNFEHNHGGPGWSANGIDSVSSFNRATPYVIKTEYDKLKYLADQLAESIKNFQKSAADDTVIQLYTSLEKYKTEFPNE